MLPAAACHNGSRTRNTRRQEGAENGNCRADQKTPYRIRTLPEGPGRQNLCHPSNRIQLGKRQKLSGYSVAAASQPALWCDCGPADQRRPGNHETGNQSGSGGHLQPGKPDLCRHVYCICRDLHSGGCTGIQPESVVGPGVVGVPLRPHDA